MTLAVPLVLAAVALGALLMRARHRPVKTCRRCDGFGCRRCHHSGHRFRRGVSLTHRRR